MRRRLFTILSGVSLLLSLSSCALRARSYSKGDAFDWISDLRYTSIGIGRGQISFQSDKHQPAPQFHSGSFRHHAYGQTAVFLAIGEADMKIESEWYIFGFGWRYCSGPNHTLIAAIVPLSGLACLLGICSIPSLLSFVQMVVRFKSRAVGACEYCGYDLRATPDRCPECGAVPKTVT